MLYDLKETDAAYARGYRDGGYVQQGSSLLRLIIICVTVITCTYLIC